jgi:alkylation response protein AidB-like acyl-CoA dehydrogenase
MTVGLLPALTDEQEMFVDASARFMDAEMSLTAVRALAGGTPRDDAAYRSAAAELGWLGLLATEADGGGSISENPVLDAAIVAAELGARLQPGPFAGHAVVVDALSNAGGHLDVLGGLASGREWATWTFGSETSCTVRVEAGDLIVDGRVEPVADAGACAHLLVVATGPAGCTQVLVPADAPGVSRRALDGLDITRRWFAVELAGVRVPVDAVVGTPGRDTERQVARETQLGAVLVAADAVGAMHADFTTAVQYAKDRTAFGRPIGSFQAIKHILADTSLSLEMSKGIVADAARALGAGAVDGPELAHAAKAFVSEHSVDLMHSCFQVFGGIGFTWEHDQHLYLRRLAADAVMFGSAAWHRTRLLDVAGAGR